MTNDPTPTPQTLLGRPGSLGTATVIRGNARCLPLPDNSVDLIVTSPPYFALRSYQDNGEHYAGQIGDEPTPTEFIDSLIEVTTECVRVLKPSGSLWVNLGDKYAQSASQWQGSRRGHMGAMAGTKADTAAQFGIGSWSDAPDMAVRPKSLIGLPWRYALRCIDDLGLILRAEVILDKRNGLPESVTDRVRRSHEQVFHFVKEPRYFSAVDEIREPHQDTSEHARRRGERTSAYKTDHLGAHTLTNTMNPLGKLPGSVWPYVSEPFQPPAHLGVDHYAAYATALPRRIILGWSPVGVCTGCGQGRRPARGTTCEECGAFRPNNAKECPDCGHRRAWKEGRVVDAAFGATGWSTAGHGTPRHPGGHQNRSIIAGDICDCPEPTAPTTPSIILDPFGGTGTTALVAKALGRHGISIDMSLDYGRLAKWRTNDLDQLAKVQGIKRSDQARSADGVDMDTLFDFDGGAA